MTAFALARHRLTLGFSGVSIEAFALALILFAALTAAALGWRAPEGTAEAPEAKVELPPAQAAAMVAATSTSPDQIQAVGDQAKLINARLPFSEAPVLAAHPFEVGGDAVDGRRALLCLTQAVYYEAGFEPLDGRRAVAQVVLNRMRHPAFPKSVCGVVYQGSRLPVCQFSFVCDGSLNRAPAAAAWNEAHKVAAAALAGYVERSVGSATHYHADYVAPYWAPKLTKISKLGAHIFYRWPGAWGLPAAFTGRYVGEPQDPSALRPLPKVLVVAKAEVGEVLPAELAVAGPPVARASNDVGGLLDTSKGWQLNIPGPNEISGAAARIAEQQSQSSGAATSPATAAGAAAVTGNSAAAIGAR